MASNPHDHLLVALGIGQPKSGPPPSVRDRLMGGSSAPPAQDKGATPSAGAQPQAGGKASPEEAGVVTDEQHCGECSNWHHDSGECDKVDGSYQSADGCAKYFMAMPRGGAQESAEMTPPMGADDGIPGQQ